MSENAGSDRLQIRLFGHLQIMRGGLRLSMPASRKTRAILGYLALCPRPVSRQRLCELFFDLPDDPRAALRWSLTKLRPLIDAPGRPRLVAERDMLRLDLEGADMDATRFLALAARDPASITDSERSQALSLFCGDLLEDAELPDRPEYTAWLAAQRQDFRTLALRLARQQADAAEGADKIGHLLRLMALDPLDIATSADLASALVEAGRKDEAHQLVAQTERQMQLSGLEAGPALRLALRTRAPPRPEPAPVHPDPAPASNEDGRISVAVIPFLNHSPELVAGGLMDGFLEAVVHKLSKFREIRVAGYSAALAFKGALRDPASMGRALGVSHLAGGSLMVRDGALKLRYRLVVAAHGGLVASGDVDYGAADPVAVMEDAPSRLVVLLAQHLAETARQQAVLVAPENRNAFEHFHVGIRCGLLATPVDYQAALESFEAGLRIAPDQPVLNAYAVWAKAALRETLEEADVDLAMARVRRVIATADSDADALGIAACSAVRIAQDFDTAVRAVELATHLNPLSPVVWSASAWVRAMSGDLQTSMEHWDRADRCNPFGSNIDSALDARSLCLWMEGRFSDAAQAAKRALNRDPDQAAAHVASVAAAVALGDQPMIKANATSMLRHFPDARNTQAAISIPIRSSEMRERLRDSIMVALAHVQNGEGTLTRRSSASPSP